VQPSLVRASTAITSATTPVFTPGRAFQCNPLLGGKWQWMDLGAVNFDTPVRQGASSHQVTVQIEGANTGTVAQTIDVDAVAFLDAVLERSELIAPAWMAQDIWDYDTRADGESSVLLLNQGTGNIEGDAAASSRMHLGPGGCWLVVLHEVQDGANNQAADPVNAQSAVTVVYTPRYAISPGT
jgi:hypothetical protein